MMTRRQKVWRNRIIVFGVFPLLVVLGIIFIDKKPVDDRGVPVPEGLRLNEQGFLEEDIPKAESDLDAETAWATAENGLPAGWEIWSDNFKGSPVEKYSPNKGLASYVIKIKAEDAESLPSPHKCTGIDEVVFCLVGNNPEVERYFKVLEYYYPSAEEE